MTIQGVPYPPLDPEYNETPLNLCESSRQYFIEATQELHAALKDLHDWANAPFTGPPDDLLFERVENVLAKYDPDLPF